MDKREQLVRAAFDLFYREGIHAVGINRVLAESGVAKKTLYHHFPAKDALIEATIEYRDRRFSDWLKDRMASVPAGREALLALFDALDDWFHGRATDIQAFHGCYFINVSAEFGDPAHPIHARCARHKASIRSLLAEHVNHCAESAEQASYLLDTLCLLKEGAIVRAHVEGDRRAAQQARQVVAGLLVD